MFGAIKNVYKKSEAAVVVQNLLEHQVNTWLIDLDPAKLARQLVEMVWESKPDVFNGKFGQRPHKITVAACALANGIEFLGYGDQTRNVLTLCLGNILAELHVNGGLYPLNSLDLQLLNYPSSVFSELCKNIDGSASPQILDNFTLPSEKYTWEEWLRAFKSEAEKVNPQFKENSDGASVIDLMENEPLMSAYREGVNPKTLAREFAANFDITRFGK